MAGWADFLDDAFALLARSESGEDVEQATERIAQSLRDAGVDEEHPRWVSFWTELERMYRDPTPEQRTRAEAPPSYYTYLDLVVEEIARQRERGSG